ncbi:hypothetical protein NPIL_326991 [Nephila pilipes]|uniref:Uncharacterized protein n=1 Tax=Nephila pilipes TaxID=299642 RepID=A0A8X6TY12_NEPPI|nr:hypothetical protein NPIL_326991 [Nephila pilipes]
MSLPSRVDSFRVLQWNADGLPQSKCTTSYQWHADGVKKELKAEFRIIKEMGTDWNKREIVHLEVWKRGVLIQILAIFSPPCNSPDFSYVNHGKHAVSFSDFNAPSPMWGYSVRNEA